MRVARKMLSAVALVFVVYVVLVFVVYLVVVVDDLVDWAWEEIL